MVTSVVVPLGLLGADAAAVKASFDAMATEENAAICVDYATKVWDEVWRIKGKGISMYTAAGDFDYVPTPASP